MKGKFLIRDLEPIDIIPEINIYDKMDGTPDSVSFSFVSDTNYSTILNIKEKCEIQVYKNNEFELVGNFINENEIKINNITYTIENYVIYNSDSEVVGAYNIEEGILSINNIAYYKEGNNINKDLRKQYYMCISSISSDKMSTKNNNGYMNTISLKEQTILLKDCIRTDITISPSLYPEDSHLFDTLYDATLKIIDCHNMVAFNEKIQTVDYDLRQSLQNVACPNLTYRDLSTYSQLYDVMIRVGRIPYLENGVLYGLKLQGNQKEEQVNLDNYTSISNLKEEGVNDNIYCSKVYNNVFDDEVVVTPQIFTDLVSLFKSSGLESYSSSGLASSSTEYVPYVNNSPDVVGIKKAITDQFNLWSNINVQSQNNKARNLLFVSGFNSSSQGVEDARSYSLELPFRIQEIYNVYSVKPKINVTHNYQEGDSRIDFNWEISNLPNGDNILENTSYSNLSTLQKRQFAYYVRGDTKVNSIIALSIIDTKKGETSIWEYLTLPDQYDADNSFVWANATLYNALKKQFYIVEYKPIMDMYYTNYDYYNGETTNYEKPMSISNYNLPYSQVTDKQVFPNLEYSLQKGLDNSTELTFITTDYNILNTQAGDIVKYKGKEYIANTINYVVNNVTIECKFTLTSNIIQNSIVSNYQDSVRTSSLMTSNSSVVRPIHLFGENVIRLMSGSEEGSGERELSEDNFITDIGNNISKYSLGIFGLSETTSGASIYSLISKYPFRFGNVVATQDMYNPQSEEPTSGDCYIRMTTGTSQDTTNQLILHPSDFPIKLSSKSYGGMAPRDVIVCNSVQELQENISNYGYWNARWFLTNTNFDLYYLEVETVNGTKTEIKPDIPSSVAFLSPAYWPIIKVSILPITGYSLIGQQSTGKPVSNYICGLVDAEYATTRYGTENVFTNSGLISKIEYSFPNSSYCTSSYLANINLDKDFSSPISFTAEPTITSAYPVLFNRENNGCTIDGFGYNNSTNYSLTLLNHISNKGYLLDLRENPRPYIQYKSIARGSSIITNVQLNSNEKYMNGGVVEFSYTPPDKFIILKIPKFINLENFDTTNDINYINDNLKYCNCSIDTLMSETTSAEISCDLPLIHSNEYDYCLFAYRSIDINDNHKILKFNIKDGQSTNKLRLRTEIYSEL